MLPEICLNYICGEKCKLEELKYGDVVTYWQLSPMYFLLFEDMANAQNLCHILQTPIQSLTCVLKCQSPSCQLQVPSLELHCIHFYNIFSPVTLSEVSPGIHDNCNLLLFPGNYLHSLAESVQNNTSKIYVYKKLCHFSHKRNYP